MTDNHHPHPAPSHDPNRPPTIRPGYALDQMREALDVENVTFDDVAHAANWGIVFLAENRAKKFGEEMRKRKALREQGL